MRNLIAIIIAIAMLCSFACAETLRVGMECNYAPFNWTQADASEDAVPIVGGGYADGYDVRIAKLVAESLGMDLEIVKTEWDGLIPSIMSGAIDCIIAGMSPTEERMFTIDFSDPYYESDLVIVVKADGAYANAASLADFAGAKITGQLNTFHYSVIEQIPEVKQQTAMDTFPTMIVALTSGVIDGYVSERPGAVSACAANSDLTYVTFEQGFEASEEDTSIAVALRQTDTELCAQINEILAGIDADTRNQLMDEAVLNQPASAQ